MQHLVPFYIETPTARGRELKHRTLKLIVPYAMGRIQSGPLNTYSTLIYKSHRNDHAFRQLVFFGGYAFTTGGQRLCDA